MLFKLSSLQWHCVRFLQKIAVFLKFYAGSVVTFLVYSCLIMIIVILDQLFRASAGAMKWTTALISTEFRRIQKKVWKRNVIPYCIKNQYLVGSNRLHVMPLEPGHTKKRIFSKCSQRFGFKSIIIDFIKTEMWILTSLLWLIKVAKLVSACKRRTKIWINILQRCLLWIIFIRRNSLWDRKTNSGRTLEC